MQNSNRQIKKLLAYTAIDLDERQKVHYFLKSMLTHRHHRIIITRTAHWRGVRSIRPAL